MPAFRIVIEGESPGICNPTAKARQNCYGCGKMGCTDCEARRAVAAIRAGGATISSATIVAYPGSVGEVVDDIGAQGALRLRGEFDPAPNAPVKSR